MRISRKYLFIASSPAILAWGIMALSAFLHPCFHDGVHHCGTAAPRGGIPAEYDFNAASDDGAPCCDVPCPVCHVLFAVAYGGDSFGGDGFAAAPDRPVFQQQVEEKPCFPHAPRGPPVRA